MQKDSYSPSVTGLEMTLMMASGDDLRGISLLGSSLSRDERNIIVETSAKIAAGMDPLKAADLLAGPWRQRLNAATMLGQSKTCHQAEIVASGPKPYSVRLYGTIRPGASAAKEIASCR